jgi:hypothetical protein
MSDSFAKQLKAACLVLPLVPTAIANNVRLWCADNVSMACYSERLAVGPIEALHQAVGRRRPSD